MTLRRKVRQVYRYGAFGLSMAVWLTSELIKYHINKRRK